MKKVHKNKSHVEELLKKQASILLNTIGIKQNIVIEIIYKRILKIQSLLKIG